MTRLTLKRILIFVGVFLIVGSASYLLIQLTKGYRPDFAQKTLRPTGLLVATSIPDGAQLFIDGELKSATNTTVSLPPDEYEVEIRRDGFSTWKKNLKIEKEVVVKTEAYLFSLVPDLKALTFTGAFAPSLSPDGTKLIYVVSGEDSTKNGLWVLDLPDLPFGRTREPKLVVEASPGGRDFTKASFTWSPDSKQVLVNLPILGRGKVVGEENFLIDPAGLITEASLIDITSNLKIIQLTWQDEEDKRQEERLKKLPKDMVEIVSSKTKDINFSPDETKILYVATGSAVLADFLPSPPPSVSHQKQEREIKPGQMYVYDIKEDRNFRITEERKNLQVSWFPTSRHLFLVEEGKVQIVEYDGTNLVTVYDGPFENLYAFPWPNASKILVLTRLSTEEKAVPNLYAVSLR